MSLDGWRFKTEWNGFDVWAYSLSEPPGRRVEIPGPASTARAVELGDELRTAFRLDQAGNVSRPNSVLVDVESGKILEVFMEE
jgi:hypothetical protein